LAPNVFLCPPDFLHLWKKLPQQVVTFFSFFFFVPTKRGTPKNPFAFFFGPFSPVCPNGAGAFVSWLLSSENSGGGWSSWWGFYPVPQREAPFLGLKGPPGFLCALLGNPFFRPCGGWFLGCFGAVVLFLGTLLCGGGVFFGSFFFFFFRNGLVFTQQLGRWVWDSLLGWWGCHLLAKKGCVLSFSGDFLDRLSITSEGLPPF